MCGRYRQASPFEDLCRIFGVDNSPSFPSANIVSPGMTAPVVRRESGRNEIHPLSWGYRPRWSKGDSAKVINARAETLTEKPSFRDSLRSRRCVIPADGFFEWEARKRPKRIWDFHLEDRAIFGFAGLWDEWCDPQSGKVSAGFTIITRAAQEPVRSIHDRMPLILQDKTEWQAWLETPLPLAEIEAPPLLIAPADLPAQESRQLRLF